VELCVLRGASEGATGAVMASSERVLRMILVMVYCFRRWLRQNNSNSIGKLATITSTVKVKVDEFD
jgi:hypothetical protein